MEHKSVIVRTRKGNTVDCFLFMTPNYNCGNVLPTLLFPIKIADKIELSHFVGGMLCVVLTSKKAMETANTMLLKKYTLKKTL